MFDTAIAADLSILESQKEFVRRYQQHSQDGCALPMLTSACPGERLLRVGGARGVWVTQLPWPELSLPL